MGLRIRRGRMECGIGKDMEDCVGGFRGVW